MSEHKGYKGRETETRSKEKIDRKKRTRPIDRGGGTRISERKGQRGRERGGRHNRMGRKGEMRKRKKEPEREEKG